MEKNEIQVFKATHALLMKVCDVRLSQEEDKKIENERDFCQKCVMKESRVDFLLKLFSLQESFEDWMDRNPEAIPSPNDEEAAQAYLDSKLSWLRAQANTVPPERARTLARESVRNFGAHFTGKLIHSSATDAAMLATDRPTRQAHVTSRRLRQADINIPLDQSQLDNKGVYQRVLRVFQGDPVVEASGLDPVVIEALRQGIADAAAQPPARVSHVDHRLRQVLLPDGDGYLAVSPLASGGMSVLLHKSAEAIEEAVAAEEPEQEAGKPKGRGRPAKNKAPQAEIAIVDGDIGIQSPPNKSAKAPKHLFIRIALPFGGAIPRNATLHGREAQESFFFRVPWRNDDVANAWRFVYRSWRPWVSKKSIEPVAKQLAQIEQSTAFQDSDSQASVNILAARRGALAVLVRDCHAQAVELATILPDAPFHDGDKKDVPIDEDLLRRYRTKSPIDLSVAISPIDLAIVNQGFGAEYRDAMSLAIIELIRKKTLNRKTGEDALSGMASRRRAQRAIEKILEDI